ncbi:MULTISPECIES: molybdate ABC transporter permease subunit [unclassified Methylocaldum]|jgi:molybdate transport system permease protein|uniref:molybdate ABC transporter permease subunit n=1 Tax=unclassified Methylocaldum TaxID=2622260 RepID=UPI00098AF265|nr:MULTISPECIES: molybdate ABC transporter permease subunit [unclassified Methylocaldum]MBP1150278.1 molybdate transport system permease protein [Methylocaldum sp. RMAD-M]
MAYDWQPLILTLKLATVTTAILFLIGVPLAYWLAFGRFRLKAAVEALVAMPLVLPPSVLGFYLLLAFSPKNAFGRFLDETFGLRLVFSFEGLVVASVLFSLPFMVHPVQSGFQNLPRSLTEAAYTLGLSRWKTLTRILLPNIKPSLLAGAVISFAHTIGEFGVVLMMGGSIPGVTRVASIAIYDEVESLNYDAANFYAFVLFALSFSILLAVFFINKRALGPH